MQPTGRGPVVDVALQGSGISSADQVDRAKVLQRLRIGDVAFRHMTRAAALAVLVILGGIIVSLVWGSWPALRTFGLSFLYEEALESGHREIWRDRADLRDRRYLVYRDVDRGPGWFVHRVVPHRIVPDVAAAADRHRHRIARRHSQHHLRHLGPVRVCAVPAAIRAAVPDRGIRPNTRALDLVRGPALRHRRFHGRSDPRHHGPAFHHLDLARRVRGGAAGAQGSGLWARLHHLGGRALRRAALHARRRDRRRHARPRPRARRNHGGHLRDRQCAPHFGLVACARYNHLRDHRQ